ncbi:hypothetical protein ACLOJK_021401 [Asimina triloba]
MLIFEGRVRQRRLFVYQHQHLQAADPVERWSHLIFGLGENMGKNPSRTRFLAMMTAHTEAQALIDSFLLQSDQPHNGTCDEKQSGLLNPENVPGSVKFRGYYRCSSTKGCSARKQVERSRTDPNMLVITYTSEHNHPWPTQRNALAGSSRSQHMKKDAHPKSSPPSPMPKPTVPKEEHKESDTDPGSSSEAIVSGRMELGTVKEERAEMEKSEEAIDHGNGKFDEGLEEHEDYKQSLKSDSNQSDDFFMDLGELEVDPIKLMFPQGMTGEKSDEGRENKGMDPFNLFDW